MLSKSEIRHIAKERRTAAIKANDVYETALIENFNFEFEKGTIIAGYYPIKDEINILPLLEKFSQNGAILCLPRINANNEIDFHKYDFGGALVSAEFGLMEPISSSPILIPQILLVPLLAFDGNGNRIGYGKGHYDKVISKLLQRQKLTLIGIAFDEQEFEIIPAESHDQKLDFVLTPTGLRKMPKRA